MNIVRSKWGGKDPSGRLWVARFGVSNAVCLSTTELRTFAEDVRNLTDWCPALKYAHHNYCNYRKSQFRWTCEISTKQFRRSMPGPRLRQVLSI